MLNQIFRYFFNESMFWVCRFTKRKTLLTVFTFAVYYLILCHIISLVTSSIWIVSKKQCVGHSVFTIKTLPRSSDWEVFPRSLDTCLCNFPIGFLYHKWVRVTLEDVARPGPAGRRALLWSTERQRLRPALSGWGSLGDVPVYLPSPESALGELSRNGCSSTCGFLAFLKNTLLWRLQKGLRKCELSFT